MTDKFSGSVPQKKMRLLFELDRKDYDPHGEAYIRPSVRSIILRENKVAMVYSQKYGYYKFPGGGIEEGESHREALIRETAEETGLSVLPESICEYGYVHRIQRGAHEPVFIQDNYYYLCNVESVCGSSQALVDYEKDEEFTLEWVSPQKAMEANQTHSPGDDVISLREARVLKCLLGEKLLPRE